MEKPFNMKKEQHNKGIKLAALLMIFSSLLTAVSCEDIFEEDITDNEIFLLAPAAGVTVRPDSILTFAWDFIEGASEYQIQVVEPSFESAGLLLLDSFTVSNKINFELPPGRYEWAVRGLNNGYSTAFFINDFIVEDTATIIPEIIADIVPLTPNGEVASGQIFFWWEDLEHATEYRLQIVTPDFDAPTELLYDTVINKAGIKLTLKAGEYSWRVKGRNEISESDFGMLDFTVIDENDANSARSTNPLRMELNRSGADRQLTKKEKESGGSEFRAESNKVTKDLKYEE